MDFCKQFCVNISNRPYIFQADVTDFESEGREFESLRARHNFKYLCVFGNYQLDTFAVELDTYVLFLLPKGSNFRITLIMRLDVSAVSE